MLVDLDLHFGTVALNLDADPGSGLCEALEQPSRIDALFVDRATVKVSDTLRILAAEAAVAETLMIDAGAIDVLLYELRRKFAWVVIDLPRWVTPTQRVVLGAATQVVILCERSLAGLRDTIRLQTLMREHAPQTQVLLIDAGASGERATVGKSEFEKAVGKPLDGAFTRRQIGRRGDQCRSAAAGRGAAQPGDRESKQLIATLAGPAEAPKKRKLLGSRLMVTMFGRRGLRKAASTPGSPNCPARRARKSSRPRPAPPQAASRGAASMCRRHPPPRIASCCRDSHRFRPMSRPRSRIGSRLRANN